MGVGIITQKYPFIEGLDAAGEITTIGSDVKGFKVGDRVVAQLGSSGMEEFNIANAAFQLFCATKHNYIAKMPDNVSYVEASVLPLAISTTASALFQSDTLGLSLHRSTPSQPARSCSFGVAFPALEPAGSRLLSARAMTWR